ncbi:MAG TPA: transposase [Gaiellaceae bacterium]|nr:transposase [Gaiellaceae bacterium]
MPRQPRGHLPAGTYHVTMRSAGPVTMFQDDTDRTDFYRRIAVTVHDLKWVCRAFCLMRTHYHLLLDVPENSLQAGMQKINGQYAQQFNRRHGRSGHLRGDRYAAAAVETDEHMLRAFRYIARNPVTAGVCPSPADWPWSSYRGSAGLEDTFDFVDHRPLRAYFGGGSAEALRLLRGFVENS